jgi:hypothetical protein
MTTHCSNSNRVSSACRMSDSKSGSKGDLNESNMPLLEAEEKNAEKSDIPEKTMEVRQFLFFRLHVLLTPNQKGTTKCRMPIPNFLLYGCCTVNIWAW